MTGLGQRHEYLKALGIDVWVPRTTAEQDIEYPSRDLPSTEENELEPGLACSAPVTDAPSELVIGPGSSNTLLVCGGPDEAATALAADIARCLDCEPVWSWPAQRETDQGIPLEQAIEEGLFTRVVVFGANLRQSDQELDSPVIRSARMILADSIPVLIRDGSARRALWQQLSASNWCA